MGHDYGVPPSAFLKLQDVFLIGKGRGFSEGAVREGAPPPSGGEGMLFILPGYGLELKDT